MIIRLIRPIFLVLIVLTIICYWGCKDSPTEPAKSDSVASIDDAYAELENQMFVMSNSTIIAPSDLDQINFRKANNLYKSAVSGSPSNATANFGAGFTEIMVIYSDPNINAMIKRWDSVSVGMRVPVSFLKFGIPSGTKEMAVPTQALAKNMAKIVQTAIVNPPLIGEIQNLMRGYLLPHIDYALARFAVVEADPNFTFKISGKMQGDIHLDTLELDNTEVYIMDGVLRGMKAMVEQFLIYRFELSAYTPAAMVQALQPNNTTFFYRASDGVARSQSVIADITSMIAKFQGAVNYLKSETDDQSNDIIKLGPSGVAVADLDSVLVYLSKALTYLSTPQSITLTNADTDGNDYTIQVNLANFYNNPPLNPKTAWLPTYTVDTTASGTGISWKWQAQEYASFTFPDPTFSGLFPGMTNSDLKRILHIDVAFSWRVTVYLRDDQNGLPVSTDVQLIINNTIFPPKSSGSSDSYSKYFTFYIMDHDKQPVQVAAVLDHISIPLELSEPVCVDIGHLYSYIGYTIQADMRQAPQNMMGAGSQTYAYLYFTSTPNGYYCIERDTTGSPFSVIDTIDSNYYYDYSVTRGKTYHYRARLIPTTSYSYGPWYVSAYRKYNYTNTVTVIIP